MIVLNQSSQNGEWLIAATTPELLESFRESFTPRRDVRVVCISVPQSEPGPSDPPTVSSVGRMISQLIDSHVELNSRSWEESRIPPEYSNEPWNGFLKKTASEARISSKALRFPRERGEEIESTLNSYSILDDAELSLEGRLSRQQVANSPFEYVKEVDGPFQLPSSVKRRLNSDGFSFELPSPETQRLTTLASNSPVSLGFTTATSSTSGYSSSSICRIYNRGLSQSSIDSTSSRLFHFNSVSSDSSSPLSPPRIAFRPNPGDGSDVNYHKKEDLGINADSSSAFGLTIPSLNFVSCPSRDRNPSAISEISEISLRTDAVAGSSEIARINEAEISLAENRVDSQLTLDESQLEFDDDIVEEGAGVERECGISPGAESDISFFSCQEDESKKQNTEEQLQEDDPHHNLGIASSSRLPLTPSITVIAKRNIRVEKVSRLQYRCQWCNRTFARSSDCYHHFLVGHSWQKKATKGQKPHCSRCGFRSNSQEDLRHHVRIRHEYACQFCGVVPETAIQPTSSKALTVSRGGRLAVKRHEECQHKVKNYLCLLCGKRFYYLVNLKAHARGCRGGSQFNCAG